MTFYKLEIELTNNSNGISNDRHLDTIYDYLSLYSGHPGLEELSGERDHELGSFVLDASNWDTSKCHAFVIMDDDFEDIINILYLTDYGTMRWSEPFDC